MNLSKLKSTLQELYFKNKVKAIFKILQEQLDGEGAKHNEFLSIGFRYNNILDQEREDLIDPAVATREKNKIGKTLIEFIKTLEASDIGIQSVLLNLEIPNKILVFTARDDKEVKKLETFFFNLNFVNVTVKKNDEDVEDLKDYDLYIFDNRDLKFCPNKIVFEKLNPQEQNLINQRIRKMEMVLEAISKLKYMIHFGDFLFWINNNRDSVQAANSKFSLHARTKEVIEYINTYRV